MKKDKIDLEQELVTNTPCPYKPIGNGLAVVSIEQMISGYKELEEKIKEAYKSGYIQASIEYTKDQIVIEGNKSLNQKADEEMEGLRK